MLGGLGRQQGRRNMTVNSKYDNHKDIMNEDEGWGGGVVTRRGVIRRRRRRNASINKRRRRIAILVDDDVYDLFLFLPGQRRCCVPQSSLLSLSTLSLLTFPLALLPSTQLRLLLCRCFPYCCHHSCCCRSLLPAATVTIARQQQGQQQSDPPVCLFTLLLLSHCCRGPTFPPPPCPQTSDMTTTTTTHTPLLSFFYCNGARAMFSIPLECGCIFPLHFNFSSSLISSYSLRIPQVSTPYWDMVRMYLLVLKSCVDTCMKQSQSKVPG